LIPYDLRPGHFLDVLKPVLFIVDYASSRILVRTLMIIVICIVPRVTPMIVMQGILKDLASLSIDLLDFFSVLIL
jgi:hypothetical protein